MKFRYARHTNDLKALRDFYTNVAELDVLASFENHDNYNGVFLGKPNKDWHIEFTESNDVADHQPDVEDLLVFYLSAQEFGKVKDNIKNHNLPLQTSKNPYWQEHGVEVKDPDGFGIVFTLEKSA